MLGDNLDDVTGIPALPREPANQLAFSSHVTSIVPGRETSNVVRTMMVHTKSFIQLIDMHCPAPCIRLLGLVSDNKDLLHNTCQVSSRSDKFATTKLEK